MDKLLFSNPVFNKGLNVTVRAGGKWHVNFINGITDVELCTVTGEAVGKGKIVLTKFVPFVDIRQEWLDLEHDHDCSKNLRNLYEEMQKNYPNFKASEEVTVLFFEVN